MAEIIKPTIIAFEVTRRCVLRCRHCRASATTSEQDVLSTDQCRKILDAIAELKKCVVVLTGGEPMMRQDIFDLTDYGKSLGLRMAIATCGALLDDAAVERFKRAGLLSFSFSLDGPDAASHDAFRQVPGAFETTLKAIDKARKADLRFQINTTLTGVNVEHLDAIARLAGALGASCGNPFVLVPVGRAEQDTQLLLEPKRYEQVLETLAIMKATYPIELRDLRAAVCPCRPAEENPGRRPCSWVSGGQRICVYQLSGGCADLRIPGTSGGQSGAKRV